MQAGAKPQGDCRWLSRAGTLAVLAVLVGLAAACLHREGDFAGFLEVGELVLEGRHPYADAPPRINTWPPVFSLVTAPLALLARVSPVLARGVWLALNVLVLLAVLRLLVRLVYDRPLVLWGERSGIPLASLAVLVPLLLAHAGVAGNFYHLQVNLLVFAIVLTGLDWQARGRCVVGGVAIGIAAAVRILPLVLIPYLLWRRRWRTALWAILAFALVFAAPALVYGWGGFLDLVGWWKDAATAGWGSASVNQSLFAMFDRYLGHGVVPFDTPAVTTRFVPESGERIVSAAHGAVLALTALLALAIFRGPVRRGGWRELTEWSVVLLVGAAFGPVAWKAYFVVLLLPFTLLLALARSASQGPRVRFVATLLLVLSFVCFTLPSQDLIGKWMARQLEMASAFTVGTLLLLAGLFWLRRRIEEPT